MHFRSRRGSDAGLAPRTSSNPSAPSLSLTPASVITGRRRNCIAGKFPGPKARPSVIFSSQKLGVTVGGCAAFYSAMLSCVPEHPVTISPVNLPACIRVSPSLLVFNSENWSTTQFFRVAVLTNVYDGSNKDDRKLQVIEHVSSSEDLRFSGNRIMYLPPNLLVQVSGREGYYLFASGASIGAATAAASQQVSSSSSSWQTLHEFTQVELEGATGGGDALLSGSRDLNSRSSVASNQSFSAAPGATGTDTMNALAHAAMVTKRMSSRRNLLNSSTSSASLAPSIQSSTDGYYHSVPRDGVKMVKVVCRAQHTAVLYKSGKWGLLGKMAVDYTSEERGKDTTGVNGSRGSNAALSKMLVDLDCGDAHIAALTEQGFIMTWGEGTLGRLGHGNEFSLRGPQAIKSLFHKRIVHVACGSQHTVAAAEDGDVYSWGYGKCGALGHGLNEKEQAFESVNMPMEILTLKGKGVTRIACGDAHTAVVLQNGTLLTCGWSEYGRLGRGLTGPASEFSSCFEKVDVKKKLCTFVACGAAHTLVLTECKSLFAFGWNVNGQLGLGDRRNRPTPTLIQYFDADELVLTSISAGKLHSMALTQDARVFAWGCDELGQCGISSFPQIYTVPHLVASTVGVNATQVSAGEGHSVVLATASQKQLDAMQANHPTRYATLLDNFELFVKSDAARQTKVLTHAKETQRRREHAARTRKPPIDPSSSLAKALQLQCRVQSDMAQFDVEVSAAKHRACRPHTAGAVLSSRSLYGSRDEKDSESSVRDAELVPRSHEKETTQQQKRVRCSSATLWRQTRLFTFPAPEKQSSAERQSASSKPKEAQAGLHGPMSPNMGTNNMQAKLSAGARKSLAILLDGDAEPRSAHRKPMARPATGGAVVLSSGNQQHEPPSSPAAVPCGAQQSSESPLASFPVSRPKSAPSQTRCKHHH